MSLTEAQARDSLQVLDEAIAKVYRIKSNVATALCLSPTAPGQSNAAADQLEYLQQAEQQILQLQQLRPQLQRVTAAPQQPTRSPDGQASSSTNAWAAAVQQQAGQYASALQQQVQQVACYGNGQLLQSVRSKSQSVESIDKLNALKRALGEELLLTVFRVTADRGWMQIHLFKSSNNTLLAEMPNGGHHRSERGQAEHRFTMSSKFIEESRACDEVRVMCNGVFCASIALAGPGDFTPVRVIMDSADKISSVDPWTTSKHQVFKRISYLGVRALHHFQQLQAAQQALEPPDSLLAKAATPEHAAAVKAAKFSGRVDAKSKPPAALHALECLLWWLACYDDLFSRRCAVSGSLIAWEPATAIPLPPVLRPYWLDLDQLRATAADRAHSTSSGRRAYHTHLAPAPPAEAAALVEIQQSAAAVASNSADGNLQQNGRVGLPDDMWATSDVTDEQLYAQLQEVMM